MSHFRKYSLLNIKILYFFIIFLFSFLINIYYAKFGAFPIDTFLHYDSGYRILNNEFPVRDYWLVSSFAVDFLQALFFKIFGVNWFAYTIHSSLINAAIALFTYYFFLSLGVNEIKSLIFTISFSTLAYTVSGTPFVDHHATFFSLMATYIIIKNINLNSKYLWFFVVFLFFFAFLSKQVPTSYIIILECIIVSLFLYKYKNFRTFKIIIFSFFICLILFILTLIILKIDYKDFYLQYIDYPSSIGSYRVDSFSISSTSLFNKYKFLILPIFLIIYLKFIKIKKKKIKFFSEEIFTFSIFLAFFIGCLIHQSITRNQIFIYFLIPIIFAFIDTEVMNSRLKLKNIFSYLSIIILVFITFKYHLRYNENRKFHELNDINFNKAVSAKNIDKSLNGLLWINPFFEGDPNQEISYIKLGQKQLESSKKQIMLISHYSFLDSITEKKLNYPNKSFTFEGASMPIQEGKFFEKYKKFLFKKIDNNKIEEIYFFKHENISRKIIETYFSQECYKLEENNVFYIYKIQCLK